MRLVARYPGVQCTMSCLEVIAWITVPYSGTVFGWWWGSEIAVEMHTIMEDYTCDWKKGHGLALMLRVQPLWK